MDEWPNTGCKKCDNSMINIVGNPEHTKFFEVKQKCVKHGAGLYFRPIVRKKPELKVIIGGYGVGIWETTNKSLITII